MLKKIVGALVLLLVVVVAANYLLFSAKFEYSVGREMSAKPPAILAAMQDLRTWDSWSPWSKAKHPEDGVEFSYEGEPGVGMKWIWRGGKELGDGWLQITRVTPDAVDYKMSMLKPFAMDLEGGLRVAAAGDKTMATWWSRGEQDMIGVGRIMNAAYAGQVKSDYAAALDGLEAHVTR